LPNRRRTSSIAQNTKAALADGFDTRGGDAPYFGASTIII
jgi:hypothetical protein